ncbi:hypothetical protein O9993_16495 [Vibrio lentus]|nr:hypothetical protein [Vibrio lentus]
MLRLLQLFWSCHDISGPGIGMQNWLMIISSTMKQQLGLTLDEPNPPMKPTQTATQSWQALVDLVRQPTLQWSLLARGDSRTDHSFQLSVGRTSP